MKPLARPLCAGRAPKGIEVEVLSRLLVLLGRQIREVEGLERLHRLVQVEHLGPQGGHRGAQPGMDNVVTEGVAAEHENLLEYQHSPPAGLQRSPHLSGEVLDCLLPGGGDRVVLSNLTAVGHRQVAVEAASWWREVRERPLREGSRPLSRHEAGEAFQPGERDLLGVQPFEAESNRIAEELVTAFDGVEEALHLLAVGFRAVAGEAVSWHLTRQPGANGEEDALGAILAGLVQAVLVALDDLPRGVAVAFLLALNDEDGVCRAALGRGVLLDRQPSSCGSPMRWSQSQASPAKSSRTATPRIAFSNGQPSCDMMRTSALGNNTTAARRSARGAMSLYLMAAGGIMAFANLGFGSLADAWGAAPGPVPRPTRRVRTLVALTRFSGSNLGAVYRTGVVPAT